MTLVEVVVSAALVAMLALLAVSAFAASTNVLIRGGRLSQNTAEAMAQLEQPVGDRAEQAVTLSFSIEGQSNPRSVAATYYQTETGSDVKGWLTMYSFNVPSTREQP